MHIYHYAGSLLTAKADLVKIFKYGSPKLKQVVTYLLRRAAESIGKLGKPSKK